MTHAELLRSHANLAIKEGGMYYSGEYLSRMADVAESLETENAKLRELVDGLTWCCEHHGCRQECPLYDVSEPDHCREVSIKRELGVEVG